MNAKISFLVGVATLLLAGCSSTPTTVNTGPIQARTFNFISAPPKRMAYAENRQEVHTMIQNAIAGNLAAKGVTKVDGIGDVTVAYLVIVGNNAVTMSVDDYFGYGRDSSGLVDKAHKAQTSDNKDPNYFEAGTLLIDIVDSKSHKLLKRSYATRPILKNVPVNVRAARIQEIVDDVLRDLRVAS